MAVSVQQVTGNPNDKVATFRVNANLLGDSLSKIAITRDGQLRNLSPLAYAFFQAGPAQNGGDLKRVDITREENGNTLVALTRHLVPWRPVSITTAQDVFKLVFQKPYPPVLSEKILQTVPTQKKYDAGNDVIGKLVQDTFNQKVNPDLALHGGSMELLNVALDKSTAKIYADVALIGSCNSCSGAEERTLAAATKEIRNVLEAKKKQTDNADFQRLQFESIRIRPVLELALTN